MRDFILEEKIGAGGVGEVWRARHQHLDKTVAIKAIFHHLSQDSHFHDRFIQEAVAMASLEHPHIVGVHDFFFLDNDSYLVMSYIEGGSLEDLLRKHGRLPLDKTLQISGGILDALNFAHSMGVIHRDVKPSNILVRPDGHAYLVDFGIALVLGQPRVTRFGTNVGTPEYMSPEQIRAKDLDHRTDVYSFGCVLYEMLTGHPPFGGQDAGQAEYDIMNGHLHEQPLSLRGINPEVDKRIESVVLRALAKEPSNRYGGCQEMVEALCILEDSVSDHNDRLTQRLRKLEQTRKYLFMAIAILCLSTALTFAVWMRPVTGGTMQQNRLDEIMQENSALKRENGEIKSSLTRLNNLLEIQYKELESLREKPR